MKVQSLSIFLVVLMISLANVPTTQANSYVFTTVSYPEALESSAIGLNDLAQVVGEVYPSNEPYIHGLIYSAGAYAPFHVPVTGATHTTLNDINNAGKLVGHYDFDLPGYNSLGFLYADGVTTDIVPPGATDTSATSINNFDIIVGTTLVDGKERGFKYEAGTYTFIDYPGADGTRARGINDTGTITGYFTLGDIKHGFMLVDGTYSPLDAPDALETRPHGVNNAGQIVGTFIDSDGAAHAFLYYEGMFTTLDFGASDINNLGQIVGANTLATPVPLPSAGLLLGSALAGLVPFARARRKQA
jgi:probable HAF family extracellular repeat protein